MRGECIQQSRPGASLLRVRIGLSLLALLSLPLTLRPQSPTTGALRGSLADLSGAPLPRASLTLSSSATGVTLTLLSGASGQFTLPALAAGEYTLRISSPGFRDNVLQHLIIPVGGTLDIRPILIPASASAITVTAPSESPLDTPASATASVITPADLAQLPANGRRWQTYALLTPTANPDPEGSSLLSFRGIDVTQNSSTLDGVSSDQSFNAVPAGSGSEDSREAEDDEAGQFSGPSGPSLAGRPSRHAGASYTFSQEAVREFRVSGQNYSSLYGHAAGGILSTVSKSGTNELHGSAFYLARSSAWSATDPFAVATHYNGGNITSALVKPHDLRQQYGVTLGGPILHDQLFFFYAFDQQRRGFPAVSSPGYATFYQLTSTQLALLGNRGVRPSQIASALSYLDGLTGLVPRRSDLTVNFAKLDWQVSPRHILSLEYNRARSSNPSGTRTSPTVDRATHSVGSSFANVDDMLLRWSYTPRAAISNDLRLHLGHDLQFETAPLPLPQEPAISPGGYSPRVSIGPQGFIFGSSTSLGRKSWPDELRLEAADILSVSRGPHLFELGADVALVHDSIDSLYNVQGSFNYDSGFTSGRSGGLADWITDFTYNVNAYPNGGCPSIFSATHDFCFRSFSQSFGNPAVSFSTQEWSFFLQDDWNPLPRITLHAGLRYEYELLPLPQQPNLALDAAFGAVASSSVFPEDRNNFGPRISFAWQPFQRHTSILRLGYGLFYGRLPGATIRSALVDTALPLSTSHIRITPTTITGCPQGGAAAGQGFGYLCAFTGQPPAAVASTTSATVFDRRFRLPAVQQASLTLEHELPAGLLASASYLLNLDRQLPNAVDINIAPSVTTQLFQISGGSGHRGLQDGYTFAIPAYSRRIDPAFGPVTDIVSNSNASYNALVLEARQRLRHGLSFRTSYTWSKALDFGQPGGSSPRTNNQFDPYNIRYDHGLSSLNYPHKLLASAAWEPDFSLSRRWLRAASSGWLLAPIFTESSGHPYTYQIFGGARLPGGRTSINGSGGARYLPTIGRNTLRLPDTFTLDLRLSRSFRLPAPAAVSDNLRLRLQAEAFNLPNHVNYSAVSQRAFLRGIPVNGITPLVFQDAAAVSTEGLNLLPFGTYTAASALNARSRQLQLGLHLDF